MSIFSVTIYKPVQFVHILNKFKKLLQLNVETKIFNKRYAHNKELNKIPETGPWNILFFGTDEFSVESLKMLHNKYESNIIQRLEVVTRSTVEENALTKYAKQKGIVINNWPVDIDLSNFHIGIVVSFGYLIPSKIIESFPLGMINVHGSLLPKWRGAAPITYTLMNGDRQTGVTIMKIKPKKFDIGEIVLQKEINISEHETLPELYMKLSKLGADLLAKLLEGLPQILKSVKPQNEANVTYAPKITSKIASVKWDEMSATNVYNLYRALLGVYPLSTRLINRTVKLHDIKIAEKSIAVKLKEETPGVAMYDNVSNTLVIKCKGDDCISVKNIVVQGKSRISAQSFNNGYIKGKKIKKILFS